MWVRGLKLGVVAHGVELLRVAPYVGAWIETQKQELDLGNGKSHPMWVRGLKPPIPLSLDCLLLGRTLCGCVD